MPRKSFGTGPTGTTRVNLDAQHLVRYWRAELGCSEDELREPSASRVTRYARLLTPCDSRRERRRSVGRSIFSSLHQTTRAGLLRSNLASDPLAPPGLTLAFHCPLGGFGGDWGGGRLCSFYVVSGCLFA